MTAPAAGTDMLTWGDSSTEPVTDALVRYCVPANIAGCPSITLPAGLDGNGQPIGVQLLAAPGRDTFLLQVASRLEAAMGSFDHVATNRHGAC